MLIDLTLEITPEMAEDARRNEKMALAGHLGTHFDVMNKLFPLEYTELPGIVFDVGKAAEREIGAGDIEMDLVGEGMFVAFCSGFIEAEGYGGPRYFKEHPQLSRELIEALLEKRVCIIGVDFAGVRRGEEHTPTDQYCAERGAFIVENLCNLQAVLGGQPYKRFTAHTYPLRYAGMTGLPCRVVAKL